MSEAHHEELYEVRSSLMDLDRRVAVLEARVADQDLHLLDIRTEVREMHQVLRDHVAQENRDRMRIMAGVLLSALSATGALIGVVARHAGLW